MPAPITEVTIMRQDALVAAMTDIMVKFIVQHKLTPAGAVSVMSLAAGTIAGRAILNEVAANEAAIDRLDTMRDVAINMVEIGIGQAVANAIDHSMGKGTVQ